MAQFPARMPYNEVILRRLEVLEAKEVKRQPAKSSVTVGVLRLGARYRLVERHSDQIEAELARSLSARLAALQEQLAAEVCGQCRTSLSQPGCEGLDLPRRHDLHDDLLSATSAANVQRWRRDLQPRRAYQRTHTGRVVSQEMATHLDAGAIHVAHRPRLSWRASLGGAPFQGHL